MSSYDPSSTSEDAGLPAEAQVLEQSSSSFLEIDPTSATSGIFPPPSSSFQQPLLLAASASQPLLGSLILLASKATSTPTPVVSPEAPNEDVTPQVSEGFQGSKQIDDAARTNIDSSRLPVNKPVAIRQDGGGPPLGFSFSSFPPPDSSTTSPPLDASSSSFQAPDPQPTTFITSIDSTASSVVVFPSSTLSLLSLQPFSSSTSISTSSISSSTLPAITSSFPTPITTTTTTPSQTWINPLPIYISAPLTFLLLLSLLSLFLLRRHRRRSRRLQTNSNSRVQSGSNWDGTSPGDQRTWWSSSRGPSIETRLSVVLLEEGRLEQKGGGRERIRRVEVVSDPFILDDVGRSHFHSPRREGEQMGGEVIRFHLSPATTTTYSTNNELRREKELDLPSPPRPARSPYRPVSSKVLARGQT